MTTRQNTTPAPPWNVIAEKGIRIDEEAPAPTRATPPGPLPPEPNRLPVAEEAGQRRYEP
jgi:hypothetical protein